MTGSASKGGLRVAIFAEVALIALETRVTCPSYKPTAQATYSGPPKALVYLKESVLSKSAKKNSNSAGERVVAS